MRSLYGATSSPYLKPARHLASTMSGLRFAAYVMGFMHLEAILRSPRIRGLSQQMFAGKGWLRQAATLTVLQVLRIHDVLDSEAAHPYDRAVAAYLLIGIYGRCRHSDLLHLHGCVHDWDEEGGFIELRAAPLKTSRSAQRKAQLVPILIPVRGVNGAVWAGAACRALERVGAQVDERLEGPLLRPPADEGCTELQSRPLGSDETSDLLRGILGLQRIGQPGDAQVSSHSLKATALSWAAKFGMDRELRLTLGRHASAVQGSDAVYSRDLAVGPVRALQDLIDAIHDGSFCPDAARSGYFPRIGDGLKDQPARDDLEEADGAEIGAESSSSSSSTEESSDDNSGPAPVADARVKRPRGALVRALAKRVAP